MNGSTRRATCINCGGHWEADDLDTPLKGICFLCSYPGHGVKIKDTGNK